MHSTNNNYLSWDTTLQGGEVGELVDSLLSEAGCEEVEHHCATITARELRRAAALLKQLSAAAPPAQPPLKERSGGGLSLMTDLSTDAQVVLDAKRYRLLKAKAVKETAYDRYGNGCHWRIGLYSDESGKPFDDVIDDLINGPENVTVEARQADAWPRPAAPLEGEG